MKENVKKVNTLDFEIHSSCISTITIFYANKIKYNQQNMLPHLDLCESQERRHPKTHNGCLDESASKHHHEELYF